MTISQLDICVVGDSSTSPRLLANYRKMCIYGEASTEHLAWKTFEVGVADLSELPAGEELPVVVYVLAPILSYTLARGPFSARAFGASRAERMPRWRGPRL